MHRLSWKIAVILLFLFLLSACGKKDVKSSNQEAQGDSAITGELKFYTSQPDEDAATLVKGFNEEYPNVKVETFRSGTEEVISKIKAEKQAGSVEADVLLVADTVTFEGLKEEGFLHPYQSKEASALPDDMYDPEGCYYGTKVMATGIIVNTEQVKELPDSWEILIAKDAKKKAIMPSPFYSGAAAYTIGVLSRQNPFGWDYLKQLKVNGMTVTKGNGAVLKAVASGEASYGVVVDFIAARAKEEGSPVDFIYPKEGVPVITEPIGMMKDTKNKEAAEAFIDFILSEKGQKLAAEIGYTPIRKGVHAPEGLKQIDELHVIQANISDLYRSREVDKKQFSGIFGE